MNKDLEKIYEKFLEDLEPTEEMKVLYNELSNKIIEIKELINEEIEEKIDDLEELFSKVNSLESKEAFYEGFSVATNIILDAKK